MNRSSNYIKMSSHEAKHLGDVMMANSIERKPGGRVREMRPYDSKKKNNSRTRPESYAQLYKVSADFIYNDITKPMEPKEIEVVAYGMKNAIAAINEVAQDQEAAAANIDVNLLRRLPFQGFLVVAENGRTVNEFAVPSEDEVEHEGRNG